jgi:hypothetical protein
LARCRLDEVNVSEAPAASTIDPLQAMTCPRCDYPRLHEPSGDVCSECGWKYSDDLIVLVGRGRGRFDSLVGGSWRGMILVAFCGIPLLFFWREMIHWTVVFAIMLVAQLAAMWLSPTKPRMQLWLASSGCGQIASTAEARIAGWIVEHAFWLVLPLSVVPMLLSRPRTTGSWIIGLSWLVVTCIAALAVARRKLRFVAREPTAHDLAWLRPWSEITDIELFDYPSLTTVRIRIARMQRWGNIDISRKWVADIECACSRDQMHALNERLYGWSGILAKWK